MTTTLEPAMPKTPGGILRLWFGLDDPVGRRAYLLSGVLLMAVKYLSDNALIAAAGGHWIDPLSYLNPVFVVRTKGLPQLPLWANATLALWTLPFIWIGVSMTVRRAASAGLSAWAGLLFFVPIINYVFMVMLSAIDRKSDGWVERYTEPVVDARLTSAMYGLAAAVGIAIAMVASAVWILKSYAAVLFFATPFVMGATSAYIHNRHHRRTSGESIGVAVIATVLAGGVLLLFAFEGIICLVMAFPIAVAMAAIGALIGMAIATHDAAKPAHLAAVILSLPLLAGAEAKVVAPPLREVVSTIEIDAPPERVWPNVIGFTDLPEPERWFFRLGIAYPQRAVIHGEGVGAVRHCEFSTGPFVEPITCWEAPSRLSFDVAAQPPSMHEWSPYANLHPPHLEGTIVSRRGEFRLVPLDGGRRTRLEGSTWYTLDMWPQGYWGVWSDALIHAIHGRVLAHVKALSERAGNDGREP